MEKIQENICKQACSYVFVQENYIQAHVVMYFLHLVLTFTPHYIIMVKGLLDSYKATAAKLKHVLECVYRTNRIQSKQGHYSILKVT